MLTGSHARTPLIVSRKLRHLRCRSDDCKENATRAPARSEQSIYAQEQERLYRLVANAKSAEMEQLEELITGLPLEEQFKLIVQFSTILLCSSLAVSALCGVDLLGGVDVMHVPLGHFSSAITAAAPLLLARWWFRSDDAPEFVRECHDRRTTYLEIMLRSFSMEHALLGASVLSISVTAFVFPCFIGCAASSVNAYFSVLFGDDMKSLAFASALLLGSGLMAIANGANVSLEQGEQEAISSANQNAYAYYRLMNPADCSPSFAEFRSRAFREASWDLVETNKKSCILAAVWGFVETLYGGALWHMTGDALATFCLFLCLQLADTHYFKSQK